MKIQTLVKRTVLGLVGAAAITASIGAPAFAAPTVTQVIKSGGELTASVKDAGLETISTSNVDVTTNGTLLLNVDDPRGTGEGWNVTLASSDFVYDNSSPGGQDIPSKNFAIAKVGDPIYVAGQPINEKGPLRVDGGVGSLDSPRETIEANPGTGTGQYEQELPVTLLVPAYSLGGVYTAVLTVSITTGP